MGNTKKLRLIIYLSIAVAVIGIIVFVSRGPHISNALKRLVLPEIEAASGRKVIAQRIYLNIFPLFIEAKGLKVFDDDGNRVLTAERVKVYVELSGLLRRVLIIRRIVVKEPEIWTDRAQIKDIVSKVRDYIERERKTAIKVKVRAVEARDGGFSFYEGDYNALITGKGLSGEVLLGEVPKLKVLIKEVASNLRGWPDLKGEINSALTFRKGGIEINRIDINSYGSEMHGAGFYSPDGKVDLKAKLNLLVDSVKKIFGLKQRGEGKVSAEGDIKLSGREPVVDMKLKGDFYIQTLMELLKVKERIEGLVDFDGRISGPLSRITGSANARLKNGNLFDVDLDDLRCKILYKDGVISFRDGKAALYKGHADAEASLTILGAEHYSLKVKFTDVDSPAALKLIGWEPGIPNGKVKGEIYTSGSKFNPSGWFSYESRIAGEDVLGRVKKIEGDFKLHDDILSLSNTEINTDKSAMHLNGNVDIAASTLALAGKLETIDTTDLTSPYFQSLRGSGGFIGTITGTFSDPHIKGKVRVSSAFFDDYSLEDIRGELSYRKNLLDIKELSARSKNEHHAIRGNIKFTQSKEIFDLSGPVYELTASMKNAKLSKLVRIFYKELPLNGLLNAEFKITGKGPGPEYSGSALITNAEAYKIPFDSASLVFFYDYRDFAIKQAVFKKGDSNLMAEGRISHDEKFYFKASTDRLFIRDTVHLRQTMPQDAVLSLEAEGRGTFDNPVINLNGRLSGGTFKGKSIGSGTINASIKDRDILFRAIFFDEKLRLRGKAYLADNLPWTAELDIQSGRYDFLMGTLLKDLPEDLLLNMKGRADLSGNRNHFTASAVINQVNVALFGYSFSNDSDIRFRIDDRKLSLSAFTMRSGSTSFNLRGNMEIGREYDMVIEGNSALSPLKGLSKKIGVLRGDADFVFAVTGKWDKPKINGGLNVTDASFGLKDIHHRWGSINGYLYIDEDRIVIPKLSGKLGGGDLDVSGLVYLKGFNIKRFYLDALLNNITASVSKDFAVNFNGNILYKGTLDAQNITGEVKINRARYRERVEWKSWLLKAKPKERPKAEIAKAERAELNIKIYGTENIAVDNNIARAPLRVDMLLRGTIAHPVVFGRLEAKEGTVYFRNNEFRILNASADFSDPKRINPVMEIAAETAVKGYNIKLNLEGQLEHFNLSLTSDPPLEEIDIFALLTVGRVGRELKGIEGGIGASEATSFLTGKVQDVLEERLRSLTGLDRIQVDPYVLKSTGTVGPRVTVSKRLLADRLFVTYTTSVGSTEEQLLKLEYILGKNVSLVGVRDEKGSVGGDIKFRFEFK